MSIHLFGLIKCSTFIMSTEDSHKPLLHAMHVSIMPESSCTFLKLCHYVSCLFQNRGEQGSAVQVSSRVLSSVAGALYGSAILLYDTELRSVIRAMPWILSAISCAVLDLSVSFDMYCE